MILESGVEVEYRKVCLCAGGSPKLISEHPNVIGIRDTASVLLLQVQYCTVQYSTVQYSTTFKNNLIELTEVRMEWGEGGGVNERKTKREINIK